MVSRCVSIDTASNRCTPGRPATLQNNPPEIAHDSHQHAAQTQPSRTGADCLGCAAPFPRNNLPAVQSKQFEINLPIGIASARIPCHCHRSPDSLARPIGFGRNIVCIDNGDRKTIGFSGVDDGALSSTSLRSRSINQAATSVSSWATFSILRLHRRVIARFERFRHRGPDQIQNLTLGRNTPSKRGSIG